MAAGRGEGTPGRVGIGPGLFFGGCFPTAAGAQPAPRGLLPRESSGFLAQSGVPDPGPGHDKHLVLWGKASKGQGDAVALRQGSEDLPLSL